MKKIILCNATPAYFEPIKDRIEFAYPNVEVVYATTHEEAVSYISEPHQCLVITDSIIAGNGVKNPTDGATLLLNGVRERKPGTRVVLYALTIIPIETKNFDVFIDAIEEKGFDKLFKEVGKFCTN
jgi:hypothetical protein